jgi:hypothetical protein
MCCLGLRIKTILRKLVFTNLSSSTCSFAEKLLQTRLFDTGFKTHLKIMSPAPSEVLHKQLFDTGFKTLLKTMFRFGESLLYLGLSLPNPTCRGQLYWDEFSLKCWFQHGWHE